MKVIVLDGNLKSALSAVRSLGRKSLDVICGADRKTAMSLFSKYVKNSFVYTSPLVNKDKFFNEIMAAAKNCSEKPLIYSFSDETFLPLARKRSELGLSAKMIVPASESIEIAYDKVLTLQLAKKKGIPIPKTYFIENLEEVKKISSLVKYPVVIKPRHSCQWHGLTGQKATATFAQSPTDLTLKYNELHQLLKELPLIQEFIRGQEYGVEFLYFGGEIKAVCAHRRIRSLSPTGGASVVKETIKAPKAMEDYARLLLDELKWEGVAMVEFKIDQNDNIPKLMEINGRFWGSLPLAIYAGVDFPYLAYRLAEGENIKPVLEYKIGVKSRHFLGDIKHLLSVFFKADPMRPFIYPSRINALIDFLKPTGKDMFGDVMSLSDPKPFLMEIIDSFNKITKNYAS